MVRTARKHTLTKALAAPAGFRAAWVFALVCALVPVISAAESSAPVSLGASIPELLEWADRNSAELAALRHDVEAAEARAQSAGALDDPMLRIELQDIDPDNPALLPGQVGATKYTLLQSLPWWGKRDLRSSVARAGVEEAQARLRAASAELRTRAKTTFARYFYADHARRITAEVLDLMRDLERIAHTRYANGLAPQQDVIKAQTEQTTLHMEFIALEFERRQAQARLNALLNRPVGAPLSNPGVLRSLPPPEALDALQLDERARQVNPQLAMQAAQIQSAQDNDRLVIKNRYPDFTVGVSPMQRADRLDSWELMFEVNIPLQQSARRHQEQSSGAMLAAAQQRAQAMRAQVSGELQEAIAGYEAARDQEQLLRSTLMPQAEATFSAALASYQIGKVDFATLLDAQRGIRAARLGQLKARVELDERVSEVERLMGEDL